MFKADLAESIQPVVAFLQEDVGLNPNQLVDVITRFPVVFSYSVKAHLRVRLGFSHTLS